jgi:hypothetical protein
MYIIQKILSQSMKKSRSWEDNIKIDVIPESRE